MKYPKMLKDLTCFERILLMGVLALVLLQLGSPIGAGISCAFMLGMYLICVKKRMR